MEHSLFFWKIFSFLFVISIGTCIIFYNFFREGTALFNVNFPGHLFVRKTNLTNFTEINCSVIAKINDMTPKQMSLQNRKKPSKPPPYLDKGYLKDCELNGNRSPLYSLLRWWIDFAAEHDIVWWMRDGSLIGTARHHDVVPWDSDMDLSIMSQFEPLIRNLSTPRGQLNDFRVNIVTRPGDHCPYNGDRLDCSGKKVTSQTDSCAFCGPLARVFRFKSPRVDLYMSGIEFGRGNLMLYDESHTEYRMDKVLYPLEWIFPLRNCSIMGLDVLCPRDASTYLKAYYGNYEPKYECIKKEWVKITEPTKPAKKKVL